MVNNSTLQQNVQPPLTCPQNIEHKKDHDIHVWHWKSRSLSLRQAQKCGCVKTFNGNLQQQYRCSKL